MTTQINAPFEPLESNEADAPQNTSIQGLDSQVQAKKRAPRRKFSVDYKLKILDAHDRCDNSLARGALFRKEGLYSSTVLGWRRQRDRGALGKASRKTSKTLLVNQQLHRENIQLKKKLAQAEAVLELQKKVSELLGQHILPQEMSEIVL